MKKQLIDQSAHFIAAFIILAIVHFLGTDFNITSGAALGFAFGMIREITEDDPVMSGGSLIDILFWTLGGSVAGFLF